MQKGRPDIPFRTAFEYHEARRIFLSFPITDQAAARACGCRVRLRRRSARAC